MRAVEVGYNAVDFHAQTRSPLFFHHSAASGKQRFNVGPFDTRPDGIGKYGFQCLSMFAVHG